MDTENATSYSIEELAEMTGFDRRTIRSFIEQGLMRGPDKMGRYAQYSQDHLVRLLAIKNMKEMDGFSTGVIRTRLLTMSQDEVDQVALSPEESFRSSTTSATDYLKSIRGGSAPPPVARAEESPAEEKKSTSRNAIELLLLEFSNLSKGRSVRNKASAETWHRISVTPDVEISVRGLEDETDIARLTRIADHLREFILGNLGSEE
ncbi:MAG: MerR family transcriptional regulator [Candidatus Obscuribacterales bacterium]|nr:MerR family transcriptional regulator [Cyanobacteria bacterium HKST-UBA01]MCB9471422.1 MerR family transcriptional regulator [Candidatus Obscuribacterales bacterium]